MLTMYFMRGINIQKYSNVSKEERVFSPVGCLSLSGYEEISEAAFEAGISLTENPEQERKRLQNVYAPMLRVLSCVLLTGKVKLFLEVEMKRERVLSLEIKMCERECVCAVSVSQNVREWERVLGRRKFI